ncbi:MAG TPA: type VI secretion system baseplate subunit TssE [Gemmataceae bacterium]|jgi:type VI secretion system protein ImpF
MARESFEQGLMPSIVDRLIDPDSGGTAWRHGYGVDEMVDAVRRDLEELLNTRQSHAGLAEKFGEVRCSVLAYGLPDLTSVTSITPQQRAEIGRIIEAAVARFEPRLRDVSASMIDPGDGKERAVKFRIAARLNVDPAPDVAFDTILELTSGRYSVQPTPP